MQVHLLSCFIFKTLHFTISMHGESILTMLSRRRQGGKMLILESLTAEQENEELYSLSRGWQWNSSLIFSVNGTFQYLR